MDATANATFTDRGKNLVIEQNFDPPTQVCIKVAEIEIKPSRTGTTESVVALKPADGVSLPKINRVAGD